MDWQATVMDPVNAIVLKMAQFVPNLLGALVILFAGWLIAKVLQNSAVRLLQVFRFDQASEKAGIADLLRKGDIHLTPKQLIGNLIYWLVMLVVFVTAVNALGLTTTSELLNQILLYVPNVIAAVFVMVLGMLLASFLTTVITTAMKGAGVEHAALVGAGVRTAVITFSILVALEQLGIATQILQLVVTVVIGSIGLGLALAFGLGCKDLAANLMDEWLKRK